MQGFVKNTNKCSLKFLSSFKALILRNIFKDFFQQNYLKNTEFSSKNAILFRELYQIFVLKTHVWKSFLWKLNETVEFVNWIFSSHENYNELNQECILITKLFELIKILLHIILCIRRKVKTDNPNLFFWFPGRFWCFSWNQFAKPFDPNVARSARFAADITNRCKKIWTHYQDCYYRSIRAR